MRAWQRGNAGEEKTLLQATGSKATSALITVQKYGEKYSKRGKNQGGQRVVRRKVSSRRKPKVKVVSGEKSMTGETYPSEVKKGKNQITGKPGRISIE